jgi:protein-S-isoprenylcysteine O-methyltransferase Ste14
MPPSLNQLFTALWSGWLAAWPSGLLALIWIGWLVSWLAASFWVARAKSRVMTADSLAYRVPIFAGAVLLTPWVAQTLAAQPLWNVGNRGTYLLALVILAGCLLAWWARIHLGLLWSSAITRKEEHRVIETGPYRFVRHPIYAGLIAAILATGVAVGTLTALVGAALIVFGLCIKARMEEQFLSIELGADAYTTYRRRVPMLVPLLPRR